MSCLTDRYNQRRKNLNFYFNEHGKIYCNNNNNELNLVWDIEVAPNEDSTEAITYSSAIMSCDDDSDICYKYNSIEETISKLIEVNSPKIIIYVHNLFYDIKPFLIKWIENYGNHQKFEQTYEKLMYNPITRETKNITLLKENKQKPQPWEYKPILKNGQLYSIEFYTENKLIIFKDSLKICPLTLQRACQNFLQLELPKDGLDYNKVRKEGCYLTDTEKGYIYDDVFGLKYLIKKLVIDGFEINGQRVQYTKLTNSSQSLYDYKMTLLQDYINERNTFADKDYHTEINHYLTFLNTKFNREDTSDEEKSNLLFNEVYPKLSYFEDDYLRNAYFGGMSYVDFDNIQKIEKNFNHRNGMVFDVNSLYPFTMQTFPLPVGKPNFSNEIPFVNMSSHYKNLYNLYIQEITIYDFQVKKDKIPFIQIKDNPDFNGREIVKNNIDKKGKRHHVKLFLPKPLFEMLFECYDVRSYKLGGHMAFQSKHDLFKTYLDFWGEIKRCSKGAEKEIAKLRQNALYGKFGTSGDNEITLIDTPNNTFKTIHTKDNYIGDTLYLPIALFVTAFAKTHLINGINANRDRFMYCDTDSLHIHGLETVKGLVIDDNIYGAWKHEMSFNDFVYIGPKRYAEKNSENNKWEFKCCGLSEKIMKKIDDINVFSPCEHSGKELKKLVKYTKDNDIYYYYDKECKKKIKGLFRSSKAKMVTNGTLIIEQPYMLSLNSFFY